MTLPGVACALVLAAGCQKTETPHEASASASVPPPASSVPAPATSASAAVTMDRVHRVGETSVAPDYSLRVGEVKECESTAIQPRPGNLRLGVEVTVEGRTDREVPVNPFYARLHDQERDGYAYAATFGGCEPGLKSARVRRGDSVRGWITFEIPTRAKGLELHYSPYIQNSTPQTVKFALGR